MMQFHEKKDEYIKKIAPIKPDDRIRIVSNNTPQEPLAEEDQQHKSKHQI